METLIYFLLFAGMFVVMMRFGCGAHVMGHGHKHSGSPHAGTGCGGSTQQAPQKAIDPVCKMSVDTATAKSCVHGGTVHYFCSQACREKFEAAPTAYLPRAADQSQSTEAHHGHSRSS